MKVQNPIIGRSRGSAGGMTFCKNYDKNVARAKAFEVSNPKTAAQQDQRAFFKEVAGIVATVSEEELRSLFGIKPKAMSRRNALSKQVAAAYSIDDGQKVVDFSKLQAIGNGQKVSTTFFEIINGHSNCEITQTRAMYGFSEETDANVILVLFDSDNKRIVIANTGSYVDDEITPSAIDFSDFGIINGYGYATCTYEGSYVTDLPFGNFNIKTHSISKEAITPSPTSSVDIQVSGYNAWDTFSFDLSGTIAEGGTPLTLLNDDEIVVSSFNSLGNNVFTGSFTKAVDNTKSSELVVQMPDDTDRILVVNFVD